MRYASLCLVVMLVACNKPAETSTAKIPQMAQTIQLDSVGLEMVAEWVAKEYPNDPVACGKAVVQEMTNRPRWPDLTPDMRDNILRSVCETP